MRVLCSCCVVLLVLALGSVFSGCGLQPAQGSTAPAKSDADAKSEAEKAAGEKPATPAEDGSVIPVQAAKPTLGDIAEYFETTTRVVAERRVEVLAEGIGQCVSMTVEEGDVVKQGQVLAQLDRKEMEAALGQAQVNVQQTKYQMQKAKEQFEKGILSSFEAENAKFMYEQAVATVNVQQVRIEKQTITAPIDGVITKRNLQKGQMVAAGVPAFSIVDPASYILPISPPEKELPRLAIGQEARVVIDAYQDREFTAKVRRINPAMDPVTGTIKVTLDFAEADREALREAAFARVRLVMSTHHDAVLVPKDVVIEENARRYLMVLNEEKGADGAAKLVAERREIQTGLEDSNQIEVLSGADANSLIVTLGQQTLKAGSVVSVTNADAEIAKVEKTDAATALDAANKKEAQEKADEKAGKPVKRAIGGGNRNQLR